MALPLEYRFVERLSLEVHDAAVCVHSPGMYFRNFVATIRIKRYVRVLMNTAIIQNLDSLVHRAVVQVIVTDLLMRENDRRRSRLFGNAAELELIRGRWSELLRAKAGNAMNAKERMHKNVA